MAIIFDIDGTIADLTHRLHYIAKKPKRWDLFFKECINDKPITDILALYDMFNARGIPMILVSGRSDEVRAETEEWLRRNQITYDQLHMRKAGDYRPDWVVKEEILKTHLKDIPIRYVFDDRNQVVAMWRRNGIRCLQVADGKF